MIKAYKAMIAVCMAIFLAVQTAFLVAAEASEIGRIFDGFSEGRADFYEELEFGDNDWAALCHIRLYGTDGADEYLSSVLYEADDLMAAEGFVKPTELQRAAIVLSAAGICSEELMQAAVWNNDKLERQGLNAYIWAIIAANCYGGEAPANAINTAETLAGYLLSKQLPDGGFTLKGTAADTDMTATAIYALAPLRDNVEVSAALDRAEQCLRAMQLDNGGYMSMGIENCESSAQAVVAYAALGYGREDQQAAAALAAVMSYRTEDGYSHLPDGDTNGTATVQALLALTAVELLSQGDSLYEAAQPAVFTEQETLTPADTQELTIQAEQTSEVPQITVTGSTLKLIIGGVLLLSGAVTAVILLLRKKKSLLILPVLLCAGGIGAMLLDISTPEEYYSAVAEGDMKVTVCVDCTAAVEYGANGLPENGVMLGEYAVYLPEGATAFDALIEAAREQQLRIDYTGSAFGEYVGGIGGLSEFDCGSESGWLYEVNGVRPSVSAGAYALEDGDEVVFLYTCTLGMAS